MSLAFALVWPTAAHAFRDRFAVSPFEASKPRWCERYHHAHWTAGAIHFRPSGRAAAECTASDGPLSSLSCNDPGCDPCSAKSGSRCSKIGDPRGNAILQTARDAPGQRRSIRATFVIERQLPIGGSHLGLYVAIHPRCHTTLQAILVPDRPGVYHLNVAAFNQPIGDGGELDPSCREHPLEAISPPLADEIALHEGQRYVWTMDGSLDASGHLVASSRIADAGGKVLATGHHVFTEAPAAAWFGVPQRAARYAFGAQFSAAPSPSGGVPSLLLVDVMASPGPAPSDRAPARRGR